MPRRIRQDTRGITNNKEDSTVTDLTQFNFHGEGVRVVVDEHGEPWFVLADIVAALGIVNGRNVAARLDFDMKGVRPVDTPGGRQNLTVVTEAGLYAAVIRSDAPNASAFRRWVTTEVLPSIRRTGSYGVPALSGPELLAHAVLEADRMIKEQAERIAELEPPAKAWTALADASGDWSMRDAAQVLSRDPAIEIGQNRLSRLLRTIAWIDSRGIPYQHQINTGRLASRARTYEHPRTGERVQAEPQVRITAKGLAWLHRYLGGTEPLDTTDRHLEVVS